MQGYHEKMAIPFAKMQYLVPLITGVSKNIPKLLKKESGYFDVNGILHLEAILP